MNRKVSFRWFQKDNNITNELVVSDTKFLLTVTKVTEISFGKGNGYESCRSYKFLLIKTFVLILKFVKNFARFKVVQKR